MKNVYFLEFKVRLPNGKSKTRRVKFDRQDALLAFFEKAFRVKFKDHELGPTIVEVERQRSSYYHFALVDKRTGKKYLPYTEEGGKRIYLDLRHILATREFAQNMAVEVFLVFDHREQDGTLLTRYDGSHANFKLDEFTSADLRMADLGRMMKKYYLGNPGEDVRFHFMELRARMLMETGRRLPVPSPVFSFDGFAFSFSLPSSEAQKEVPAAVREAGLGAPEPVMMLESQTWFDASAGRQVVQESVPALIAGMPVLSESLAVSDAPGATGVNVEAPVLESVAAVKTAPRAKRAMEMPNPAQAGVVMHGTEKSRERDYKDESKGSGECHSGGSSGTGSGNHGRRGGEDAESQNDKGQKKGRRARKPVPFSALSSFKAAIFDLDGVVMDSQPLHLRTFNKALEPLGVKIEGRAWKEKYPGVGSYAVFEDVFSRNGIRAGVKEYVERRAEIYYEELKKARVPEISGFGAFRRELEKSGIGVAVASGGHAPHVKESLRSAGLGKVPFVAIEQVKQGKPAPEIFLKTAKRLRVKPSECVVFEDALSGMQAAAAAGMPCVALATTLPGGKLRGKAALVVRNFRDRKLKRLLALLLAKRGNGGAGRSGEGGARKRAAPKRKSAGRRRK